MLALNHNALTAWLTLGEDLAGASWKRTRRVLLIHAGHLVERGRQMIFRMRKSGTEELQAALGTLGERSTAPGQAGRPGSQPRSAGNAAYQPDVPGCPSVQPNSGPCSGCSDLRETERAANHSPNCARASRKLRQPRHPDGNAENRRTSWQECPALTRHENLIADPGCSQEIAIARIFLNLPASGE